MNENARDLSLTLSGIRQLQNFGTNDWEVGIFAHDICENSFMHIFESMYSKNLHPVSEMGSRIFD